MYSKLKAVILILLCNVVASCSSVGCGECHVDEVTSVQTEDPHNDWRRLQQDRLEKIMNGEPDICDSDPKNHVCEWVLIQSH